MLTRDLARQAAQLHAAGIAYRDLGAERIVVDEAGLAWIVDFSLAQVAAEATAGRPG